jgi:hypothetical protein
MTQSVTFSMGNQFLVHIFSLSIPKDTDVLTLHYTQQRRSHYGNYVTEESQAFPFNWTKFEQVSLTIDRLSALSGRRLWQSSEMLDAFCDVISRAVILSVGYGYARDEACGNIGHFLLEWSTRCKRDRMCG